MDDPVWDTTTFTKNRDRLLNQEIARSFFRRVLQRAQGLMVSPLKAFRLEQLVSPVHLRVLRFLIFSQDVPRPSH
jgi:hypothetical protein